jgi:hypothetical protein
MISKRQQLTKLARQNMSELDFKLWLEGRERRERHKRELPPIRTASKKCKDLADVLRAAHRAGGIRRAGDVPIRHGKVKVLVSHFAPVPTA